MPAGVSKFLTNSVTSRWRRRRCKESFQIRQGQRIAGPIPSKGMRHRRTLQYPGSDIPTSVDQVRGAEYKFQGVNKEHDRSKVYIVVKSGRASVNVMVPTVYCLVRDHKKIREPFRGGRHQPLRPMANLMLQVALANPPKSRQKAVAFGTLRQSTKQIAGSRLSGLQIVSYRHVRRNG